MQIASLIFEQTTDFSYYNVDQVIKTMKSRFYKDTKGFVLPYCSVIGMHASLYVNLQRVMEYQEKCFRLLQEGLAEDQWIITGIFNNESRNFKPCIIKRNEIIVDSYFQTSEGTIGIVYIEDIKDGQDSSLKKDVDCIILSHKQPFLLEKQAIYSHKLIRKKAQLCYKFFSKPVISTGIIASEKGYVWDGYSMFIDRFGMLQEDMGYYDYSIVFTLENKQVDIFSPARNPIPAENTDLYYQAIVQAVKMHKNVCDSKKVLVTISGGIDSALVATLAVQALGSENVLGLFLPGPFTSQASFKDVEKLCSNLGIQWHSISIIKLYENYKNTLGEWVFKDPTKTTQENIQARIRANIVMAFSNENNSIVLNTSNKSEIAVGYSTLYGDATGALAVIGDLYKTQVYEIAEWINKQAQKEIIPQSILTKEPSAELSEGQKDSDHLLEYPILDKVLYNYFVLRESTIQIATEIGLKISDVQDTIDRVLVMEYKRKQAPPILRLNKQQGFSFPKVLKEIYLNLSDCDSRS